MRNFRKKNTFLTFYQASFVFILDDPNDVRAQMIALRPDYVLDEYEVQGEPLLIDIRSFFPLPS